MIYDVVYGDPKNGGMIRRYVARGISFEPGFVVLTDASLMDLDTGTFEQDRAQLVALNASRITRVIGNQPEDAKPV
jgi:hypothetical protein